MQLPERKKRVKLVDPMELINKAKTQITNAIEKKEWSKACEAMLDYYDKCYEFELKKTTNINSINLSGLNLKSSLDKILKAEIEKTKGGINCERIHLSSRGI